MSFALLTVSVAAANGPEDGKTELLIVVQAGEEGAEPEARGPPRVPGVLELV